MMDDPVSTSPAKGEGEYTPLLDGQDEHGSDNVDEKMSPDIDSVDLEAGDSRDSEPLLSNANANANASDSTSTSTGTGTGVAQDAGVANRFYRQQRSRDVRLRFSVMAFLFAGSLGLLMWFFGGIGWSKLKHFCHSHHHHHLANGSGLVSKPAPSRVIDVDYGSDSIHGRFSLYDRLSLSTTSGDINVVILPQPADAENPDEPALLHIRTQSGSVSVSFTSPDAAMLPAEELALELAELMQISDEDIRKKAGEQSQKKRDDEIEAGAEARVDKSNRDHIPPRPYMVDIETGSGSISGRIIFSALARLVTDSGSITANMIPIAYGRGDDERVAVHTYSKTGSQLIRLTEPVFLDASDSPGSGSSAGAEEAAMAMASHATESGGMHIEYPHQWAGTVRGESQNEGTIWLSGRGLSVSEGDGWVEGVKEPMEGCRDWALGHTNVSLVTVDGAALFYVG